MVRDPNCVFCKIVAVEIPAAVVYENQSIIAFLDVNPLADGHLLVVPREHFCGLVEMSMESCSNLFACIPTLGRALMKVMQVDGFNVLVNEGRVAGQVVPHVHCHLIPRAPVDHLGYRWEAKTYEKGRDAELASAYQTALGSQD